MESGLSNIVMPKLKTIKDNAFSDCWYLTDVNLPSAESISSGAFQNCSGLNTITLPLVKTLGSAVFSADENLEIIDLGQQITSIGSYAFSDCLNLKAIIIRNTGSVCELKSINAFNGTSFTEYDDGSDGAYPSIYVYVPSSLYSSYTKTDTNWHSFWNPFPSLLRRLEDYTIDGTVTGALDMTKI